MYYNPLLVPLFVQVLITFLVWFRMYYQRFDEMNRRKIQPQDLATRANGHELLQDSSASSDNLRNQFEMPVLFYLAVVIALMLLIQDPLLVLLAWIYVALRAVHALIHTTSNNVVHRFFAYFMSCVVLMSLWARLAWQIF